MTDGLTLPFSGSVANRLVKRDPGATGFTITVSPSNSPADNAICGVSTSGIGVLGTDLSSPSPQTAGGGAPPSPSGVVGICKVDAQFGPISVGDLLTTSPTPGHAIKADDPLKAFGAIIGKPLRSMLEGEKGLIPILVALQ